MVYKNSLSPTNMTITDVGGIVSQLVTFRAGMSVGSVLQIAWTSTVLDKVSLGSTMNNQVQLTYELAARTGKFDKNHFKHYWYWFLSKCF